MIIVKVALISKCFDIHAIFSHSNLFKHFINSGCLLKGKKNLKIYIFKIRRNVQHCYKNFLKIFQKQKSKEEKITIQSKQFQLPLTGTEGPA